MASEAEVSPLKLVFLGSDPIALPLLNWLAGEGSALAQVVAVFTQPDRPAGRGQAITANAIKAWALGHGLPVIQPEKLTAETRAQLAGCGADVALVMAYGQILDDDFIATPRLGTLNLHTSLLPRYRGASPIQAAIASGERATGVTLMRIVRKLDAGPVAGAEHVTIGPLDTAQEIEGRLAEACIPLLGRTLPRLRAGTLAFEPQDDAAASYCRRLVKTDGALDFTQTATVLAARINGLFPWPACAVSLPEQEIKIGLADAVPGVGPAGVVLGTDADGLRVGTGGGVLRLRRLQRPGGKMLAAGEFLRGFALPAGTAFASRPMPPLVSSVPFTVGRGR
jgi:methionyl-tRNA formyltransferase